MMGHQWDNETPWNYSIFEYLWVYFKSRSSIIFETKYVQYSVVVVCSLKHDLIFKYIGGPSGVDLWPGSLNLYDQRCELSLVPRLWYDWLGTHDYLELLSIGLSNCIWNIDSLVNPTVYHYLLWPNSKSCQWLFIAVYRTSTRTPITVQLLSQ